LKGRKKSEIWNHTCLPAGRHHQS